MASKLITAPFSILILRSLALMASVISMALLASSHYQQFGASYDYEKISTFRYVMPVAVISIVYGVVQLPFAASYALKHKRLIPQHFEFYADMVMNLLLATSSGAGIAVSCESKKRIRVGTSTVTGISGYYDDEELVGIKNALRRFSEFHNKLLAASVFLFVAWLFLAVVSIISYNNNSNPSPSTLHHHQLQSNTVEHSPTEDPAQHSDVTPHQDVKVSSDDVSV
ncbi:CASP-like protein 4D1 [Prosopis cineraria]|uniref:CASP-like protein 4D1 n=1 Tax=Prosopis cineraria TaxID=364024 RepID=UPI00240F18DC|nr:CASP-like protein 4D1 [Prosopis cineraria]